MRGRHAIVVLALLPVLASGQLVPEGSTPDEVVRAWGQPRSRSAAKGREIWLYPEHQAVFEHGRLTSLVALPAEGGNVAWQKRAPAEGATTSVPVGASSRERLLPAGSRPAAAGAASEAMIVKREGGKLILRSPERAAPPPPKKSGGWLIPALVTFLLLVLGGAGAAAWHRWRRRMGLGAAVKDAPGTPTASQVTATLAAAAPVLHQGPQFPSESKPPTLVDWELTPELLRTMEWKRFELLVQRYFAASGLRAKTHLVGADGAVELYLYRGRTTRPFSYVQCRSWGSQRCADARVVRELFAVMAENRVLEGMFVTTGGFTPEAEVFARQNRITLVSGTELLSRFNRLPQLVRARILTDVTAGDYTTPSCPRCTMKLVPRDGGADGAAGWVCRRFPQCRYTISPRADVAVGALQA